MTENQSSVDYQDAGPLAVVVDRLAAGRHNPFVPSRFGWNAIRIFVDDCFDNDPTFAFDGEKSDWRIPLEFLAHAGYAIRYFEQQFFPSQLGIPDLELCDAWALAEARDELTIDPFLDWVEEWATETGFPSIRVVDGVSWSRFDLALHDYANSRYLNGEIAVRSPEALRFGYATRAAERAVGLVGAADPRRLEQLHFEGAALVARGEVDPDRLSTA